MESDVKNVDMKQLENSQATSPAQLPGAKPRSRKRWLWGVVMLAAVGGGWYGLNRPGLPSKAPRVAAAPAAIPITATHAVRQDLAIMRSGLGTVTALSQVDVKVRVDGQVQRIAFTEGQEVKAGDLLAQIDPRPYQAQLEQAQATLQKDMAQLENARTEEARAARLNKVGAGTSQASDTARSQVAINQALTLGDQAAVDTATLNLDFATITAPISGRVGLKQVNEGAVVRATDATGLVTITQMRPISVQFSLPQDELPDLVAGQANAPLAVSVDSRDGSRHLADGKLAVIDSQVETTTGTIKLKADFDNDDRRALARRAGHRPRRRSHRRPGRRRALDCRAERPERSLPLRGQARQHSGDHADQDRSHGRRRHGCDLRHRGGRQHRALGAVAPDARHRVSITQADDAPQRVALETK